jgi:hypothetical protein
LIIGIIAVVLLVGMCSRKASEMVRELEENPVKSMAEMAVWANPDVEMVSSDEEAGTITIRDKKTGTETTLNYEEASDGKFTVESDGSVTTFDGQAGTLTTEGPDGTTTLNQGGLEKMPKWFVVPDSVKDWKSASHSEQGERVSGVLNGTSAEDQGPLMLKFEESLKDAGFALVNKTENNVFSMVSYEDKPNKRTVGVLMTTNDGIRQVQVTYKAK